MKFTDEKFLAAVQRTLPERGQMERIATYVGCSHTTVLKRLYKLADLDLITLDKRRAWDKQEFLPGNHFFGGAGSCIRRYLVAKIVEDDPTPWCHVCGAMEQDKCDCGPYAANH